jgi:plasmid stabilization system protein ParE
MAFKVEIRPLATAEIIDAFDWYEFQKEGLGVEFLNELEKFYNKLSENPNIYSYYDEPVREGKIDRFPYIIISLSSGSQNR